MKKLLAVMCTGVVVAAGSVASDEAAWAAAEPASFTVDCSSDGTLNNDTTINEEIAEDLSRVVSGTAGEKFTITNSSEDAACTVTIIDADVLTGPSATVDDSTVTILAGANAEFTIGTLSGAYTITPGSDAAVTFAIDNNDCQMAGAGIATAPFLVFDAQDLKDVGAVGCGADKHYLQTETIRDIDTSVDSDFRIPDFTGVYDGDHYELSYSSSTGDAYAARNPVFSTITGTVQRVRLTGTIRTTEGAVGSLATLLGDGAVISEINSSVALEVRDHDAKVGGLVAEINAATASARIQYSRFSGSVTWEPTDTNVFGPTIGGLFGHIRSTGYIEIRDSYAVPTVTFDSSELTPSTTGYGLAGIFVGGLVGSIGTHVREDLDGMESTGGEARIIRSYFAGTVSNTCVGVTSVCFTNTSQRVFSGGLVGLVGDLGTAVGGPPDNPTRVQSGGNALASELTIVSSFWLSSGSVSQAVGVAPSSLLSSSAVDYLNSDPYLPVAVPVSATELRTLSSFTTEEDRDNTGNPGGEEIAAAASDRSSPPVATAPDYRWAITTQRSTFVPSTYTATAANDPGSLSDQLNFTNRALYDPLTDGAKEYLRLRGGVLGAYGGEDPRSTTTYTTLGNVWEICNNERFPTLVWEERNTCGDDGDGSSTSSRDRADDELSAADAAAALGLTEAEYAAFLASGLTLEQFRAQRLAATGASSAVVSLSAYSVLVLFAVGGIFLWWSRRHASAR